MWPHRRVDFGDEVMLGDPLTIKRRPVPKRAWPIRCLVRIDDSMGVLAGLGCLDVLHF